MVHAEMILRRDSKSHSIAAYPRRHNTFCEKKYPVAGKDARKSDGREGKCLGWTVQLQTFENRGLNHATLYSLYPGIYAEGYIVFAVGVVRS